MRVVDNVTAENDATARCHGHVEAVLERNDHLHKASTNKEEQTSKEPGSHLGKVVLGLEREKGEAKESKEGDDERLQNGHLIRVGNQNTNRE